VKDDLVEGRDVLRLDHLERQEMMAVQLDEARAFLARGTVAHARLAFLLLDNSAEVIMRRNIEAALSGNKFLVRIRDRWREILAEASISSFV
jgi:S-adenosylmethionine:diacylglycerol 3-amino-3-carboxypropyl transferase